MASYQLEWRRSAVKDLRRLPSGDVTRIVSAVEALSNDPNPPGCTKLTGSECSFRIRMGNYRILYDVRDQLLVVEVIKIGHRIDVYRG